MHASKFVLYHLISQDEYSFYSIQKLHEMIHVTNEIIVTNKSTDTLTHFMSLVSKFSDVFKGYRKTVASVNDL